MFNISTTEPFNHSHSEVTTVPPAHEGGVFSGKSVLNSWLAHFLVQVIIIIVLSRLFDLGLRFLRQPRVIAEIVSGICLGPSVLGRIPGFSDTIFPPISLEPLKLVANIGLVLYMFLVGLELDPRSFFANIRNTAAISLAGMLVPFALGLLISWGMYGGLQSQEEMARVPFTSFLLFTGVAMSITAFPILARIMSERKLFGTRVGSITISSAAFDDATAWCLLALVLSIIYAGNQLTALWVFLTMIGYVLFLLVPVRLFLAKMVKVTMNSRRFATWNIGQSFLAMTFVFIFISAWITEFIGVHAMFGAFLVGVIMPRGTGIVVSLTEKIEDLVSIVLLPLYFASSGLKTQIGLLNDAKTWGWLVAVITVACAGKICGCMFAAKAARLTWREALSVGILMNTKGLVELIVLNIGLDAGVINRRIFAVMVVMCLVTTFMTSPLIAFLHPSRKQISETEAVAETKEEVGDTKKRSLQMQPQELEDNWFRNKFNLLACLDQMEQVTSLVNVVSKLHNDHPADDLSPFKVAPLDFNVLRFMEVTERSSTTFYAASSPEISPAQNDMVLQNLDMFARLLDVATNYFYAVSPLDSYSEEVDRLHRIECFDAILMPVDHDGANRMTESILKNWPSAGLTPILYVHKKRSASFSAQLTTTMDSTDPKPVQQRAKRGDKKMLRVLMPFVGGAIDRKALQLALRMCDSGGVHLTILYVELTDNLQSSASNADIKRQDTDPDATSFNGITITVPAKGEPIDMDKEALKDAKRYGENKPTRLNIRCVTTNNILSCLLGECKENKVDIVVMGQSSTDVNTLEKEGMFTRVGRKLSSPHAAFRHSLRRKSSALLRSRGWGSKEAIIGALGSLLLNDADTSLLIVCQPSAMEFS